HDRAVPLRRQQLNRRIATVPRASQDTSRNYKMSRRKRRVTSRRGVATIVWSEQRKRLKGDLMGTVPDPEKEMSPSSELDQVIAEVVSEAHLQPDALRPEERDYLKEHALKKPLG